MMRSETELIAGIRRQESGIFEEFVRRYQRQVFFTSLRLVGEHDDALDIAQEVFLKMWRFAPKLKKEVQLGRWVYRVTVNTCIDRLRQRTRIENKFVPNNLILLNVAEKGMGPREHARMAEELQVVKNALTQLTEKQRSVFVLRHFQNQKLVEISEILDMPLGTVKATLHQALYKLRGLLGTETNRELDVNDQSG